MEKREIHVELDPPVWFWRGLGVVVMFVIMGLFASSCNGSKNARASGSQQNNENDKWKPLTSKPTAHHQFTVQTLTGVFVQVSKEIVLYPKLADYTIRAYDDTTVLYSNELNRIQRIKPGKKFKIVHVSDDLQIVWVSTNATEPSPIITFKADPNDLGHYHFFPSSYDSFQYNKIEFYAELLSSEGYLLFNPKLSGKDLEDHEAEGYGVKSNTTQGGTGNAGSGLQWEDPTKKK